MPPDLQTEMATAIGDSIAGQVPSPRTVAGVTPPERLALHARNHRASLTAALAGAFPTVERLTGAGFFAYAAAQFIAAHPPAGAVVAHYGDAFPGFIAGFAPTAAMPWLADVARCEWAICALGDVLPANPPDGGTWNGGADASVAWSPAARLFASAWPVDALMQGDEITAPLQPRPVRLLLRAGPQSVVSRTLTLAEHAFLEALMTGAPVSAAIVAGISADPLFDAVRGLGRAVADGCISKFIPTKDSRS